MCLPPLEFELFSGFFVVHKQAKLTSLDKLNQKVEQDLSMDLRINWTYLAVCDILNKHCGEPEALLEPYCISVS